MTKPIRKTKSQATENFIKALAPDIKTRHANAWQWFWLNWFAAGTRWSELNIFETEDGVYWWR